MDKRTSVMILMSLLMVLTLWMIFITPSQPPPSSYHNQYSGRRSTMNTVTDSSSRDTDTDTAAMIIEARRVLRNANRTYHSANLRINELLKHQTRDRQITDELQRQQSSTPRVGQPSSSSLPSPSIPSSNDGSKFCAMRPSACEFNDQQRDMLNEWSSRPAVSRTCRGKGTLGRSSREPVIIQLMDDLGGWSHILPAIIDATNNGICDTHCRVIPFGGGDQSGADILFTSLYHEPANLPRDQRKDHQVMAAIGLEAWNIKPDMYDQMDILMSHHPQSQVPVNYYYGLGERCAEADKVNPDEPLLCLDKSIPNFSEKRDDAYSGLFITNCNAKVRKGYLKELGEQIPLHSYGSCLHTAGLSSLQGQGAKRREAQKYKFFISFENTVLDGYLTEKFFEGFSMNTLMVYWGAPDMESWLPANHSAINAHDFAGPKELASFLKSVSSSEEKWNSYFEWKKNNMAGMRPSFAARSVHNLANRGKNNFFCRACDYYAKQYCS